MLTFQEIIVHLNRFWEKQGCVLHHGHDLEVGAGTFNPATFLRCLGPEPYKAAYVEPSRRPQDGRYGDNPNRIQLFHQYQVVLKPSPQNIQAIYLDSLKSLGLDLQRHDIRFVHDDWESPTLGAWGLGWEVWCDGMEITQFTYFQAVGSVPLKPIPIEITYGLERLALFLQHKDNLFDVRWNGEYTLRDIIHRSEVEWSMYNFEEASVDMWRTHFADFEREAKALIARHLPIPAYDFVIKASHAFNMLDARGAISVTERTGYVARIRDLARLVSADYVAMREKLGFPLLAKVKKKRVPPLPKIKHGAFNPKKAHDFLLEIGSEQLPQSFIPIGEKALGERLSALLQEHGLSFSGLKTFGSPQRLACLIHDLCEGSEPKAEVRRGPAVHMAFDARGTLTPQGKGFLRAFGIENVSLQQVQKGRVHNAMIENVKGTPYLFGKSVEPSRSALEILAAHLPKLILDLPFPKKMRWGEGDIDYARPIHWIVALFGTHVVRFPLGGILSGHTSRGHAQLFPHPVPIKRAGDYERTLKKHFVLASTEARKKRISTQLAALEKRVQSQALEKERVLREVLFLTEWPTLTCASFDPHYLRVPKEVLISEMVTHQKVFPLADRKGKLSNAFVITADTKPNGAIRQGNVRVLSARLADGVFLYEKDVNVPLERFNEALKNMVFQKELGSMFEKVERLAALVDIINARMAIADHVKMRRAALLSKADLASGLVREFPELQGTIGRAYALAQKEDGEVATAIEEQYLPRHEGDPLPTTPVGIVLSLADKMDNLLGCYSIGAEPTSSSDPYGLRRQAIGLLKICIALKASINLETLFADASTLFPQFQALPALMTFLIARLKGIFEESGFKKEEADAVLATRPLDPFDLFCKLEALHAFRQSGDAFAQLHEVHKRAKGILETPAEHPLNPALCTQPAEREVLAILERVHKEWKELLAQKRYVDAFHRMASLQKPLAHLFDTVRILDPDPQLRDNRTALLQAVFSLFRDLLDFTQISAKPS